MRKRVMFLLIAMMTLLIIFMAIKWDTPHVEMTFYTFIFICLLNGGRGIFVLKGRSSYFRFIEFLIICLSVTVSSVTLIVFQSKLPLYDSSFKSFLIWFCSATFIWTIMHFSMDKYYEAEMFIRKLNAGSKGKSQKLLSDFRSFAKNRESHIKRYYQRAGLYNRLIFAILDGLLRNKQQKFQINKKRRRKTMSENQMSHEEENVGSVNNYVSEENTSPSPEDFDQDNKVDNPEEVIE